MANISDSIVIRPVATIALTGGHDCYYDREVLTAHLWLLSA